MAAASNAGELRKGKGALTTVVDSVMLHSRRRNNR